MATCAVALSCQRSAADGPSAAPSASPSLPAIRLELDGFEHSDATATADDVSAEAQHSDVVRSELADTGFVGASDRVFIGGRSAVARAALRAWAFGSDAGASEFLGWLARHAPEELIAGGHPVAGGPPMLFVHEVGGCCHQEVPIYLAAWQRGDVVWTLVASGPRIRTEPVIALVRSVKKEV